MSGVHWRHFPGDPDRPALALHPMMGSGAIWGPIADRLQGRVDLRAFDMPGHGRSGPWQAEPGVDFHTTVTRIAGAAIDRPVDLIGHSFGATVALRIAARAPEAVRTLTLIEPVLFAAAKDHGPGIPPEAAHAAADGDIETAARGFLGLWGGPGGFEALAPLIRAAAVRQMPLVIDADPALSHDVHDILRESALESIDAPVLFISGADSPPVIHAIAEALSARLPDVGRATIPDAGHMAPLTHPAEVAGLIAVNLDRA